MQWVLLVSLLTVVPVKHQKHQIYYWLISDVFKTIVKLVSKPSHAISSNKVELKKMAALNSRKQISSVASEDIRAVHVGFMIKNSWKGQDVALNTSPFVTVSIHPSMIHIHSSTVRGCRFQWRRGLRRRSAAVRLLRSWVRIPPRAWMFVCCECCVLLGRGLCDELITRPGESYRLRCVVVCDLETSRMRRPWPALGRSATKKNGKLIFQIYSWNENLDISDSFSLHQQEFFNVNIAMLYIIQVFWQLASSIRMEL
jgi:hypothetical protein